MQIDESNDQQLLSFGERSTEDPDIIVERGFQSFVEWAETTKLKILACEVGLVCPVWRFGGTLDSLIGFESVNRFGVLDLKTSNAIYPDHLVQVSAYRYLAENGIPPVPNPPHIKRFQYRVPGVNAKGEPVGKVVPRTTTILGRFKESGGLLHWAHKQGLEGFDLYEKRDEAADIGTRVHKRVEEWIREKTEDADPKEFLGRPVEMLHVLRIGKEFGDINHHTYPEEVLDIGWEMFRRLRVSYELDKALKRAVGK